MEQFRIGTREPIFFMHIPKTAGMSMRLYLSGQYLDRDICPAVSWQGLLGKEKDLAGFRLVQGHFRYNLRDLVAKDARMLVMLREPLRRTVSALRHLQRDPSFHNDHHLAKGLTLSEMINHPGLMMNQNNVQARFLCASRPAASVSTYLSETLPLNPNADAGDAESPPEPALAQERLEAVEFVGLTEDIGAVVALMAAEMNYHPAHYFPSINEDPVRADPLADLSAEDMGILRAHNDVDIQLYEYAVRLIERRSFQRSMRQLTRGLVYSVPDGSFEIPMSGIIPGSGWYGPETNNGVSWRWTGPGRYFTIEVPLRSDASYRLTLTLGGGRALVDGDLSVSVNDVPVTCDVMPDGGGYRCEIAIPQAVLAWSDGFCHIRFDAKGTSRMSAEDMRILGVAVMRVVFECEGAEGRTDGSRSRENRDGAD